MKKILLLICLLSTTLFSTASEITKDIDFSGLTSWQSSGSYVATWDNDTKTLTCAKAWGGASIWYGTTSPLDATGYDQVVLELSSAATAKVKLNITYTDDTEDAAYIAASGTKCTVNLSQTSIKSIAIYNYSSSTDVAIVLDKLYLRGQSGTKTIQNLWSGSQASYGWTAWDDRIVLANTLFTNAAEGAKLKFTFTENTQNEDASTTYTYWQLKTFAGGSALTSNADELNSYNCLSLASGQTSYTMELNAADVTTLQTSGMYFQDYSLTITSIDLIYYVQPTTKDLSVSQTLNEGSLALSWGQNWSQPTSVINSLKEGDILTVYVGENTGTSQWPSCRIAWGSADGSYVGYACYKETEFPHTHALTLTADQVTAIKAAGKLYLSGAGLTITKFTLTTTKTVSLERGNASTTIWSGSQSIDWTEGIGTYQKVEAAQFAKATTGMRLRMNYSNLKMGAQGRIVDGSWTAMADADTYEKLPTAWGDYYEFTLTDAMVTALKTNGLVVSGIGYTLTSVELIDPMKEYVIATSYDSNDIKAWETADGTPNLTVTLQNFEEEEVTVPVTLSLMTDMWADYKTFTQNVTLAAGETKTVDVEMADLEAGFYRMVAKANGNNICTYFIGYNPTAIVSPRDAESDFETFWAGWKTKLETITPIEVADSRVTYDDTNDGYTVYTITMNTVNDDPTSDTPMQIKSYYKMPKSAGKHPCLVRFQGTDNGTSTLSAPSWSTGDGWAEMIVSTRGQMLNRGQNSTYVPEGGTTPDFYAYGLGDKDKHYYRAAYLDCVRAIDFVKAQNEVDTENIFLAGGSQGGCFTYVTAGLCAGDIKAIAPSITGHSDFVHTMEIVSWPTSEFNDWINTAVTAGTYADYATAKTALLKSLSYFDTKNFAALITCPVLTNFSLQDQTDGPHLNIAPYNLLKDELKAGYSINPFNGHAAASDWNTTYMKFFQGKVNHKVAPNAACEGYTTYYNATSSSLQVPSDYTVYTVTKKDDTSVTLFATDGIIPAGQAVLIKGTNTDSYTLTIATTATTSTDLYTANQLKGVAERTLIKGISGLQSTDYVYVLSHMDSDGTAFYRYSIEKYLPAGKCYLDLGTVGSGNAKSCVTFSFDDATTGIEEVESVNVNNGKCYNIQGQRVNESAKGLVIKNGVKYINK